jgi:hypothetical protein
MLRAICFNVFDAWLPSAIVYIIRTRTCMFSDSDPCGEAPGNDGIEQHEDEEWQPEEQTDDGQKKGFCPRWFNIRCAGRVVRVIFIFSNSQYGGREED